MNENENLVAAEAVAENVETTTEQTPKTYTEDELNTLVNERVNEIMPKKIARREAKIRKEYESKYGDLEDVLKAGMGKESVEEITTDLRDFYVNKKKIDIPQRREYSSRDVDVLGRTDAEEIIRGGYDEVVEEVDRLAKKGADRMSAREKAAFKVLAEYRNTEERNRDLGKIGVTADVYDSKEFKDFAGKFNPDVSITDVYNIYKQTQPKKEIKTMGSMKNSNSTDSLVKDFYSVEEARKFTNEDYNRIPGLFEAVKKSMTKWK